MTAIVAGNEGAGVAPGRAGLKLADWEATRDTLHLWTQVVQPAAAFFDRGLGEFLLPYAAVRTAPDPDGLLLRFLQSTYEAAAELGRWDRAALESPR